MSTATYEAVSTTPDDGWDTPGPTDDWDTFGDELRATPYVQELPNDSRLTRLGDRLADIRDGLVTSERQEMALAFAAAVGEGAVRGAMEGTGFVNVEKDTGRVKVRPVRLIMGAIRPGRTARKAATGAVRGARRGAIRGGIQGSLELAAAGRKAPDQEFSRASGEYSTPETVPGSEWD